MRKAFVVISGFNDRAVLAVCRALTRSKLPFGVISRGRTDMIESTAYAVRICARMSRILEIEELTAVLRMARKRLAVDRLVLLPSAEYLNRFALHHRDILARECACDLPLPDSDVYRSLSDKLRFSGLCNTHGIDTPPRLEDPDHACVPFVAKPRCELTKDGRSLKPRLFFTRADYERFLTEFDKSEYYFQEYIGGKSYYLLFSILSDGRHQILIQRNGAQQPGGRSILFAWPSDFERQDLVTRYLRLFKTLGFQGLVMIEVKQQDGCCYMIEANPRLWGPLQLTLDVDPAFLCTCLGDFLGQKCNDVPVAIRRRSYVWTGGIVETLRNGENIFWLQGGRLQMLIELLTCRLRDVYLRRDSLRAFLRSVRASSTDANVHQLWFYGRHNKPRSES